MKARHGNRFAYAGKGQGEPIRHRKRWKRKNVATFQRKKTCKVPEKGDTALAVAARCGGGKRLYGIRQPKPVCGADAPIKSEHESGVLFW